MRKGEVARFPGDTTDCTQYATVSRMLRDIEKGKTPHGCMGALASVAGHGHRLVLILATFHFSKSPRLGPGLSNI